MRTLTRRNLLLTSLAAPVARALTPPVYWPGKTWESISATEAGANVAAIAEAVEFAGTHASTGVVILRHGRILAEKYWRDWTQETAEPIYSASKSVCATLIGMAFDARLMRDVNQSVSDFIPAWKGTPKKDIALRHLLTMTSGLGGHAQVNLPEGFDQYYAMVRAEQEAQPGEKWFYHTPAYRMLLRLLEIASGEDLNALSRRLLFEPLGMTTAKWDSKPVGGGKPGVNYLWMRASLRDMSRFGLFALHGGKWNGKQLVNAAFMKEATSPSQKLNESYGYLWWVNAGASYRRPGPRALRKEGHLMPDVPLDAFAALGALDKKIYVVPSLGLVVSRHGDKAGADGDGAMSTFDNEFLGRICRAVKS